MLPCPHRLRRDRAQRTPSEKRAKLFRKAGYQIPTDGQRNSPRWLRSAAWCSTFFMSEGHRYSREGGRGSNRSGSGRFVEFVVTTTAALSFELREEDVCCPSRVGSQILCVSPRPPHRPALP